MMLDRFRQTSDTDLVFPDIPSGRALQASYNELKAHTHWGIGVHLTPGDELTCMTEHLGLGAQWRSETHRVEQDTLLFLAASRRLTALFGNGERKVLGLYTLATQCMEARHAQPWCIHGVWVKRPGEKAENILVRA